MGNLLWWRLHDRVVNKSRKKFILYKLQTQWNSDKIMFYINGIKSYSAIWCSCITYIFCPFMFMKSAVPILPSRNISRIGRVRQTSKFCFPMWAIGSLFSLLSHNFLWKIHKYHIHLGTYSQNNYIVKQICVMGYLTKYFLKLTLQRIKENSNFPWLCHFLHKINSVHWLQAGWNSSNWFLISKFWFINYSYENPIEISKFWLLIRIYWAQLNDQNFWLEFSGSVTIFPIFNLLIILKIQIHVQSCSLDQRTDMHFSMKELFG